MQPSGVMKLGALVKIKESKIALFSRQQIQPAKKDGISLVTGVLSMNLTEK